MIHKETMPLTGVVLDDSATISLRELCSRCHVEADYVIEMVEEGVIEPRGTELREWSFSGPALRRAQIALRLQRDLRVNLSGAALVLDLLEELEALRRAQRQGSSQRAPGKNRII